jgi:hypothetical protein
MRDLPTTQPRDDWSFQILVHELLRRPGAVSTSVQALGVRPACGNCKVSQRATSAGRLGPRPAEAWETPLSEAEVLFAQKRGLL